MAPIRTRPIHAFFLRSQLGAELWLPFLLLVAFAVYLLSISPRYRLDGGARIVFFSWIPLLAVPFLCADTRFDSRGWLRRFTSARHDRWPLYLAYASARLMVGVFIGAGLGLLSCIVGHDALDLPECLRLVAGLTGLGIYASAVGSVAGILTHGRLSIAATFGLVLLGGMVVAKAGNGGLTEYLLCPASLGTLESIDRTLAAHPLHALAGLSSSLLYWILAWRLFQWRTAR